MCHKHCEQMLSGTIMGRILPESISRISSNVGVNEDDVTKALEKAKKSRRRVGKQRRRFYEHSMANAF